MNEALVRHSVAHIVDEWWSTIVLTPLCGEPAKQDLENRVVCLVLRLLADAGAQPSRGKLRQQVEVRA